MNKHKVLSLALFFISCVPLIGQNFFQRLSDRDFTDRSNALEILSDGSMMIAGSFASIADTMPVIWVQRVTAQGTLLWSRQFANRRGTATDICPTADGNLLVVFNLQAATGAPLGLAGWMKISPLGNLLWVKLTTTAAHLNRVLRVGSDFIVTGYTKAAADFDQDAIALKIKDNGDIAWSYRWDIPGNDAFTSAWVDAQGFAYCSGYAVNFSGNRDGTLAKLSPSGALLWARRYGGNEADDFACVAPTSSGTSDGLLLVGSTSSFNNIYRRMWLLTTDRNGTVRLSKTYELPEKDLAATDLLALPANQFLATVVDPRFTAGSPALLLRMTDDGTLVWEYQYRSGGERDFFRQVKPLQNGFAAVGTAARNGDSDVFLVCLGGDGLLGECCPRTVDVTGKNVAPQSESFVPNSTALPSTTLQEVWNAAQTSAQVTNPCIPVEVEFTLSDTLLQPGDCVKISPPDSIPGVHYTLDLQGGMLDPMDSLRICYPDCGRFFITRTGQSSVCQKTFSQIVDVGGTDDHFPNAFTPNGDGVNDRFRPLLACPPETMTFEVYNRWGQKVFATSDPKSSGWDGTLDGQPAPGDVYAWRVEYEIVRGGERQGLAEKGDVTLLR